MLQLMWQDFSDRLAEYRAARHAESDLRVQVRLTKTRMSILKQVIKREELKARP